MTVYIRSVVFTVYFSRKPIEHYFKMALWDLGVMFLMGFIFMYYVIMT